MTTKTLFFLFFSMISSEHWKQWKVVILLIESFAVYFTKHFNLFLFRFESTIKNFYKWELSAKHGKGPGQVGVRGKGVFFILAHSFDSNPVISVMPPLPDGKKSVNLQYITLGCLDDGTNESSAKSLMFQVLFFFILFIDLGRWKLFISIFVIL